MRVVVAALVVAFFAGAAHADDNTNSTNSTDTAYVVQAKPFLSRGRVELAPIALSTIGDQFTSHTGLGVTAAYSLDESVAFDITAAGFGAVDDGGFHFGGSNTVETSELQDREALKPERVKLYWFPWLVTAQAHFSPGYGKVTIADTVLGEFKLDVFVGAGAVGLELPVLPLTKPVTFVNDSGIAPAAPTTTCGGGLQMRFTDWLGARVEVRDAVIALGVPADGATNELTPTFDVANLVLGDVGVVFVF